MRLLIALILVLTPLNGLGSYAYWCQQRPSGHYLSDLRSQVALDIGQPSPRGNLLGIQPELFAADYQSNGDLRGRLWEQTSQAQGLVIDHNQQRLDSANAGAQLINLWL